MLKSVCLYSAEYKHTDLSIRNYFVKYEEKVMIFWFLYLIMFLAKTLGSLKVELLTMHFGGIMFSATQSVTKL